MSMTEKALQTVAKYNMLAAGDRVFAGVSGGADSVALLGFLLEIRDKLSLEVTALHVNHMLRGAESERDETHVKTLCKRLGVEFVSQRTDVRALAAAGGLTLEEAGRKARYTFFSQCADAANGKIAVAHTLNDSVETAVLNLARGTALRGLAGIPPVRGNIVRPLITSTRAEIEIYCKDNNLNYITDSSNLTDDFARNKLRRHAMPVLESINPGLFKTLESNLEAIRMDADYLDGIAECAVSELALEENRFHRRKYLLLALPVRTRALSLLLKRRCIPVASARLKRLDALVQSGSGAEQLSGLVYLKVYADAFVFEPPKADIEYFEVECKLPKCGESAETIVVLNKKLRFVNADYENYEESINYNEKTFKNVLDYDKIDGILKCRQKLPQDRIRLCGRRCTKTLKKLFQESGIPALERGKLLILADAAGIVWAEGFGVCERAAVNADTKRILILDVVTEG